MIGLSKKGQVTVFVIVAIVIVGGIIAYYSLGGPRAVSIPQEFEGAYEFYLSCLEEIAVEGTRLMGSQGGYIENPPFEPGSAYAPFSSQLNFMGQAVPYWMYVSGNNIIKEQVPTMNEMEDQLSTYLETRIETCDFSELETQGYDIYVETGAVETRIETSQVDWNIENPLTMHLGEATITIDKHTFSIDSQLGTLYETAKKTYNYQKEHAFLEGYALDVMRLYAPVTGTEISCTPKVFVDEHIQKNITNGLEQNIATIKLAGDYYGLSSAERNYFVVDSGFNAQQNINFMYNPAWPTRIDIAGERVAKPVGLQEGLGILGFCYVPYHFVYDIAFPVMIQLYEGSELFQFPVSVVITKNRAREGLPTIHGTSLESPICETRNQEVLIETYDIGLNPVESHITFRCLDAVCNIGQTTNIGSGAVLQGNLPQCVNGHIIANAEGYAETRQQISTNEDTNARLVLNKKYETEIDLGITKKAFVIFTSKDYSTTITYPESNTIELIEGNYNITVQAYDDSSLEFPAVKKRRCVDVPESGIAGFLGAEKEKCFDIDLPATKITFAITGGGNTQEYITEEQLETTTKIQIDIPRFGLPKNIEELQQNYQAIEEERIYLNYIQ